MPERTELLAQLVEYRTSPEEVLSKLAKFPWDPPKEGPLVIMTRDHCQAALRRFLQGNITADELRDWASAVECREDIGFDPAWEAELLDINYLLASPEINGAITRESVAKMLRCLDGKEV